MPGGPSAKRYARAMFEIADQSNSVEEWGNALQEAQEALLEEDLLASLEYPKLTADRKVQIIQSAFTETPPMVVNLLSLLATRNRIGLLRQVVEEYQALCDTHYNRIRAHVTTAIPLEQAQRERITNQLERLIGQEVIINTEVDPDILGGVTARVGDKIIDGSLKGRLRAMRIRLADMPT